MYCPYKDLNPGRVQNGAQTQPKSAGRGIQPAADMVQMFRLEIYVPRSSPRTFPRQLGTTPEAANHQQGQQREAQNTRHNRDYDGLRGHCNRATRLQ